MADDPVEWLEGMKAAGVILREESRDLWIDEAGASWEQRALLWATELYRGVAARNLRDAHRIHVINEFPPFELPPEHIWYDARALGMTMTATGESMPGNNPASRHAALVKRVEQIITEWRQALPSKPKLAKTNIKPADFDEWYLKRAAVDAKTGTPSPREKDREEAIKHFGCIILCDWIDEIRQTLPKDHPYKQRGRRRLK